MRSSQKIKIDFFRSYLAIIKNSVGTKTFRNFYLAVNGKNIDAMGNGRRSCAFFVSNVLNKFPVLNLIDEPHLTVKATVADMERNGWKKIKKVRPGAVLLWEAKFMNGTKNKHLGFYIGNNKAVSNSSKKRSPVIHHWTYGVKSGQPARKIEGIFWHSLLGK